MKRRPTIAISRLFALLTALSALTGTARAQRDQPAIGTPAIVAHEWGVWRLEQGRVDHLEDLARELPPFVARNPGASTLPPAPPHAEAPHPGSPHPGPPHPAPVLARKPVLFLYADQPVDVTVEVSFTGGEPWFHYPPGTPGVTTSPNHVITSGSLAWAGRLDPGASPALRRVPAGHFWADLRAVGGTPFVTRDGTERFLFYDGPVTFRLPFHIVRAPGGARVTPDSTETALWLVDGRAFVESKASFVGAGEVQAQGDMTALRARLMNELVGRGLSIAEAGSLLDTWRDDLFASPRPRAISFIPRDWYDRMLPLRIVPEPVETVRVGLVIQRL